MDEKIIMYSDGGSRGNPGPAASGVYLETLHKSYGEYLGVKTNNEAEYAAVIFGLKKIKALIGKAMAKKTSVECRMDSELICKQLNHEYKIEDEKLQPLFIAIWNLTLDFGTVKFMHIPREANTLADKLVNEVLDKEEKKRGLF